MKESICYSADLHLFERLVATESSHTSPTPYDPQDDNDDDSSPLKRWVHILCTCRFTYFQESIVTSTFTLVVRAGEEDEEGGDASKAFNSSRIC